MLELHCNLLFRLDLFPVFISERDVHCFDNGNILACSLLDSTLNSACLNRRDRNVCAFRKRTFRSIDLYDHTGNCPDEVLGREFLFFLFLFFRLLFLCRICRLSFFISRLRSFCCRFLRRYLLSSRLRLLLLRLFLWLRFRFRLWCRRRRWLLCLHFSLLRFALCFLLRLFLYFFLSLFLRLLFLCRQCLIIFSPAVNAES